MNEYETINEIIKLQYKIIELEKIIDWLLLEIKEIKKQNEKKH